jgi:hypothetical protein
LQINGTGINKNINIKKNIKNKNEQVLANHRDWEKNGKIDRAHIAIGAIVFCIVIAVGIVGLFLFYFLKWAKSIARMWRLCVCVCV